MRPHDAHQRPLLERGELTPGDLATLIDTLPELEETKRYAQHISIKSRDWTRDHYDNIICIRSVGALIDEAASRMKTR